MRPDPRSTSAPATQPPVRCPGCFARDHHPILQPVPEHAVVRCLCCGLLHTSPRAPAGAWRELYADDYEPYQPKANQRHWHTPLRDGWQGLLRRWYLNYPGRRPPMAAKLLAPVLRPALDPFLPRWQPGRQLLDVGCGAGTYLRRVRALGWEAMGLDASPRAVMLTRLSAGVPAVLDTLPTGLLAPQSFDAITAWQTLEHLDRPRQALANLRRCLRPGGSLLLTVPNAAGWAARHFGPHWLAWDVPRHITHFTAETLRRMLAEEGFRVLRMHTMVHSGWVRKSAKLVLRDPASTPRQRRSARALAHKAISRTVCAAQSWAGLGESLFAAAVPR